MSVSLGKSRSKGAEPSKPISPEEVGGYFNYLSGLTGGRLNEFARTGTPQLTPEEIQAVGGLGADRTRQLDVARREAVNQITADPNLTIAQRQRSTQLTDQDYNDRLAAILKEAEGLKTGLVQYNAGRTADDLKLLADIYFGGMGQYGAKGPTSTTTFGAKAAYTPGVGWGSG